MPDVHIIGAGPSGSVAAIEALKTGHNVHISEEHSAAGLPVDCSGLVSKEGLESLSDLVDYRKYVINPIHGAEIDCAGKRLSISTSSPSAFVIDRSSFDAALASKAEKEGAKITYSQRVTNGFASDVVVGADGPLSSVATRFAFPALERFVSTTRAFTRHFGDPNTVKVYLSNEKFPGFFGWLIPHDEENAEIGVGIVLPCNSADAFSRLVSMLGVNGHSPPRSFMIPMKTRTETYKKKDGRHVMLVGDAAGQVKSVSGGGVAYGAACARLAGKLASSPFSYDGCWRRFHGKELDFHYRIHKAYSQMDDWAIRQAARVARLTGAENYLQKHGSMDRPTSLLGPQLIMHPFRFLLSK